MTKIEIIPAIMPKSFEDLNEKYSRVKDFVNIVQIDVMDGKFTQSVSWPYSEIQIKYPQNKNNFLKNPWIFSLYSARLLKNYFYSAGLPKINFDFEIDLMVSNPETEIERWIKAGAKRVVIHIESINNIEDIFLKIPSNIEVGIAININTPNEKIYPFIEKIDFVQFMGIEKIGFQRQKFDKKVVNKIVDLRNKFSRIIISVDGGVSLDTAKSLIKAGANRLVSGSVIFESDNIAEEIKKFKNLSL